MYNFTTKALYSVKVVGNQLKTFVQIFLFIFTWFTNPVNATFPHPKVALPNYAVSFSSTENQKLESEAKIGVENFARSGLLENSFVQKAILQESYVLEETRVCMSEDVVKEAGKFQNLLLKLDNLPHAKSFVNSLDEILDASLINKLDDLTPTQLDNLNTFYQNRPSPAGFSTTDYNFTASKVIDGNSVSINYKYGLPDFKGHSPVFNFTDGTSSGKFMYQSQNLTGYGTDFLEANTALAKKMGIEKINGQWPQVNAEGYLQNGYFRWRKTGSNLSQRFELFENGNWVEYTWHHYEDGITMFPVKSKIHSTSDGGFSHPGGGAIIGDGNNTLKGIFDFSRF